MTAAETRDVRKPAPVVFAVAVLLVAPFVEHALEHLSPKARSASVTCIGPADAALNAVYLHGLDSFGPSWIEIENRRKLRALSELLRVRFALPRASGRWSGESAEKVRGAAHKCFDGPTTAIIGFSDGANFTNELFLACRGDLATNFLSVGSSAGMVTRKTPSLIRCGHIWLYAGRHEPGFSANRQFAQLLARHGAAVDFVEHPGVHEIPFEPVLATFQQIRAHNGR